MHNSQLLLAFGAIVHYRPVETFTLQIVLDISSPLYWGIDAYAKDAETEEKKDANPFQYSPTSTFPLDFGVSTMATVRTCHLFWLLVSFEVLRGLFLLSIIRDLLDWSILS